MASTNPIVPMVFRNLLPLLRDVEAVELFLDAVDVRFRANNANLAVVAPLLERARRLAGRDAGADEIVNRVEVVARNVLQERVHIIRAAELLIVVRALAAARRRAHRLSYLLLCLATGGLASAASGIRAALQPLILVMVFAMFLLVLSMVC